MRCAKRRITNHPVVPVGWHASFNGRALVNAMPHVSQRFALKSAPSLQPRQRRINGGSNSVHAGHAVDFAQHAPVAIERQKRRGLGVIG